MEQKIKETIENLLTRLNITEFSIEAGEDDLTGSLYVCIKTPDSNILIGNNGANLVALDHLVKKITERELGERPKFTLDVNNYQKQKTEVLRQKISMLAERARAFKSSVTLDPMSPYERMVVHSIIAREADLKTESEGFGRERHVVIKYLEDSRD